MAGYLANLQLIFDDRCARRGIDLPTHCPMAAPQVIDLPQLFKRVPTEPSQQVRRKWRERERRWRRKEISQSTGRRVKPRGCWGFQGADPGLENVGPVEDGGGSGIRTRDTISGIHTFQACAFNHSATPPSRPRKIGESGGGFKCFVHVGSQESDKGVHCTDRRVAACSWREPISREVFVVFLRVIGGILLLAGMAALGFDLWQYVQSTGQGMGAGTGEPAIPFLVYTLSRRAPSTTRPPLHQGRGK